MKYRSKPIGQMTEDEISKWGKGLLVKIHVITGWTIPNSPELLNILTDQFQKTLIEKYGALNPDEIEYAFRHHGTSVEDWGKALNLNLVDTVLVPYVSKRFAISEDERNLNRYKDTPPQKIFTQEELDNFSREDCEREYQKFLRRLPLIDINTNRDILLKDGLLKDGESVIDFFTRRAEKGIANIYVKK